MMMKNNSKDVIMSPTFLSVLGSAESINRIILLIDSCIHTHNVI